MRTHSCLTAGSGTLNTTRLHQPDDPQEPEVRIGAMFADYDSTSSNDRIARVNNTIRLPYEDWETYDQQFSVGFTEDDAWGTMVFRIRGFIEPP